MRSSSYVTTCPLQIAIRACERSPKFTYFLGAISHLHATAYSSPCLVIFQPAMLSSEVLWSHVGAVNDVEYDRAACLHQFPPAFAPTCFEHYMSFQSQRIKMPVCDFHNPPTRFPSPQRFRYLHAREVPGPRLATAKHNVSISLCLLFAVPTLRVLQGHLLQQGEGVRTAAAVGTPPNPHGVY